MGLLRGKQVVLLDMNETFMFEADRFGPGQNYSVHYEGIGGGLPASQVRDTIEAAYDYLYARYPDPAFRENFPTVEAAIIATAPDDLSQSEVELMVDTFAAHEIGVIPDEYVAVIRSLASNHRLGAVIDIWAPSTRWKSLFKSLGIDELFEAVSFSSDYGVVKPSPLQFQHVLKQLGVGASEAIVIGDSVRRDLGGALAAGIPCILVGGAEDPRAVACIDTLLDLL